MIDELLALARSLAREAGRQLAGRADHEPGHIGTKTSRTDMVSDADRAAEALIVERLERERPDDAILGEEGAARDGTSGVRWVIDPLDGTTNYLYGFPVFGVSVAVELDGRTVAGAVYDPSRDELFDAARDGGARCNDISIHVSGKDELDTALIATGFSYVADRRAQQARLLTTILPRVRDIRRAGAAALDLCWVACGRLDGYYEAGLNPWDVGAGALIAAEAGAVVAELRDGTVSVAAPGIAAALRDLIHEAEHAGDR